MAQKIYFGIGLAILSIGMFLRLNAHAIMWANVPLNIHPEGAPYSGYWQDINPFGIQEAALNEVARVLMGFGALLALLSLYWCWRFQFAMLVPQENMTDPEQRVAS